MSKTKKERSAVKARHVIFILCVAGLLVGCGKNDDTTYTVDATVTGLRSKGLVVRNDKISFPIDGDGTFNLGRYRAGDRVALTVVQQPADPAQTCSINSSAATIHSNVTISIQCVAGYGAQLIESGNADAYLPNIAVGQNGNAVAVWAQDPGIWANFYEASIGWGQPQLISDQADNDHLWARVGVDALGNAMVVWQQADGVHQWVMARRYSVTDGWGVANVISDNAKLVYEPQLATDPSGNALVVWMQDDDPDRHVWANRYVVGSGWGVSEVLDSASPGSYPQIAMDTSGNGMAVWMRTESDRYHIYADRYAAGAGWSGQPVVVQSDETSSGWYPQVTLNSSGDAVVVWEQWSDGVDIRLLANLHTANDGWGTAVSIDQGESGANSSSAQVAMDAQGNAIVVWQQQPISGDSTVWANRYDSVSGWGQGAIISSGKGSAYFPQIEMDALGNAVAVWNQAEVAVTPHIADIAINWYSVNSGWGLATLAESKNEGDALGPKIDVNADGDAFLIWYQGDANSYSIWANHLE